MKQLKKDIHKMAEIEERILNQTDANRRWGIDKRISIPTILQLGAVIVFGATFYNQVNNNQLKNEERFSAFAEERKVQASQMIESQKVQNQILIELTKITERENYLTDTVKDLTTAIKTKSIK